MLVMSFEDFTIMQPWKYQPSDSHIKLNKVTPEPHLHQIIKHSYWVLRFPNKMLCTRDTWEECRDELIRYAKDRQI